MSIIGTLPVQLTNGTTADATQVMSDFNYVVSQTNTNAAALAGGNAFTGTQTIAGDTIVTATATQAVSGKTFTIPLGTVSLPTYSFIGDTNTGMWSPGANTIGLATNGVNAVYVDTNQNVGVGGAVPSTSWGSTYRGLVLGPAAAATASIYGASNGGGFGTAYGQTGVTNNTNYNGTNSIAQGTGAGSQYIQSGGYHLWYSMASVAAGATQTSVNTLALDVNGNLLLGSTSTAWGTSGRGVVEVNGSSTALIGLKVANSGVGYTYHDGTNMHLQNVIAGSVTIDTNATTRLSISSSGTSTFSGSAVTSRFAIGSSATLTVDWSKSNYQTLTLTANVASGGWVFTNELDGQTLTLKITQDATGSRTIASNSNVKWPGGTLGVLSTAAGAVDLLCLTYDAATGFYYATLAKGFA